MSCRNELTYSIYVDRESSREEARAIELHLAECGRCHTLVEALRGENRAIMQFLRDDAEQSMAADIARDLRGWLWTMAAMAATAGCLGLVVSIFRGLEVPASAQWLNPSRSEFLWNIVFSAGTYLFDYGTTWLASAARLGTLIAGIVLLAELARRRRHGARLAGTLVLIAVMISGLPSFGLERRHGQNIVVQKNEIVDDNLFAAGETTSIDGIVNGDLYAAGRLVTVTGHVKGDLICFAREVDVEGEVDGNIYGFARDVNIRGRADRNLIAFAQSIQLLPAARLNGDLTAFSAELSVAGSVQRDLTSFSNTANIRGQVGRNVTARGRRISLLAPAHVGGDLTAYLPKKENLQIAPGASVAGKVDTRIREVRSRYARVGFYVRQVLSLLGAWVVAMLLAWLFPALLPASLPAGRQLALRFGIGFLVCVATPIAVVLVAITIIGLPLGLIALALWVTAIYLAKIFVAAAARSAFGSKVPGVQVIPLFLALFAIWILINLPYVGGPLNFLLVLFGLGMIFVAVRARWQRPAMVG